MLRGAVSLLGVVVLQPAFPQRLITTVAGTDFVIERDGRRAADVPLGPVFALALTPSGEVAFSSSSHGIVGLITSNGVLRVIAGNGLRGFTGEGQPGPSASLSFPLGIAYDSRGNLFIADQDNQRIRRVNAAGVIDTIAGDPAVFELGDGAPAANASISFPIGLATDSAGRLYIADSGHDRIRIIAADGSIHTVAGNGSRGYSGDGGSALTAALNNAQNITLDAAGNLYIADAGNHRIRRVAPNGVITTFAGTGAAGFSGDGGPATSAALNFPSGVAVDRAGNVYIADTNNHRIRVVRPDGSIRTIAGTGTAGFAGDGGSATSADLNRPASIVLDAAGNVIFADFLNYRVRRIGADGVINTIAGSGASRFSGDGGPAISAALDVPLGASSDGSGGLYIADTVNHRIRHVGAGGLIRTIAGNGNAGFRGNGGDARNASLNIPQGSMARDASGNIYFADRDNHAVRRVSPDGIISAVAGTGTAGYSGDGGPAAQAALNTPADVAIDPAGNLYIADSQNHRVRKIAADGVITTLAGMGRAGFSGDGGPPAEAQLNTPFGLAIAPDGSIYIADYDNYRVRRIANSTITTVAGNGSLDPALEGPATDTSLAGPLRLALDAAGLYIVEYGSHRILYLDSGGNISIAAGDGRARFSGDGGDPRTASLNAPGAITTDASGNLFIADSGNNRIRAVLTTRPQFTLAASAVTLSAAAGSPVTREESILASGLIAGLPYSLEASAEWLRVSAAQSSLPAVLKIAGDPSRLAPGTYQGTVRVIVPAADPPEMTVAVTFTVGASASAGIAVEPASLAFSLTQGDRRETQLLRVVNLAAASVSYSTSAAAEGGRSWLSIGPPSGDAVAVKADPANLAPGAYKGSVTITPASGPRIQRTITLTVRPRRTSLTLTQSGLLFTAVAGGGRGPTQRVAIANTGSGEMRWTARARTLGNATGWLSVTPAAGASNAGSVLPFVEVAADPAGLDAGAYFGQVEIIAQGADNSPQNVTVVLNVLPRGTNPGALLDRTGLVFTGVAGTASVGSQDVRVFNIGTEPVSFGTSAGTDDGLGWLTQVPANARLAPNEPQRITVQPNINGLGPGVRFGTVTLTFRDGTFRVITVLLILTARAGAGDAAETEATCVPTQLLPVFTVAPNQLSIPVSYPAAIETRVLDDCARPLTTGSVVAGFSNADPPVSLISSGDGTWSGTWTPRSSTPPVITITAEEPSLAIRGKVSTNAGVSSSDGPWIRPGGIVNAIAPESVPALVPGGLISILGSGLATGQNSSPNERWQTTLADSLVVLRGEPLPLQFAGDGRITAIVPFDTPLYTKHKLVVQSGFKLAVADDLPSLGAQPALYRVNETSTQGRISIERGDGSLVLADSANPAAAGDTVVIRAAGLGPVSAAIQAGLPAPGGVAVTNRVTVTVGGREAEVLSATLAPGEIGVYLVRARVPQGTTASTSAPVVVTVLENASPAVTIATR